MGLLPESQQFPVRTAIDFTLLTRLIPAASSGASSPLSTASAANLRIADIRMMIDDEQSAPASSDARPIPTANGESDGPLQNSK